MKFLAALTVALSATAGAFAQGSSGNATTFADGLLTALRASNLSRLADAVGNNSAALLGALQGGNKTVLAPSDQAFQALGGNIDNQTLIATIAYHVLNGTVSYSQLGTDNKTIAASALNSSEFVHLPRNRSQVVVLSKHSGNNTAYVQLASGNVSFSLAQDGPQYQNIRVQPINQVLTVPTNTSGVASSLGASQLASLLGNAGLVDALDSSIVTVFAPSNEAIQAVQSTVEAATDQQRQAVLLNHVLNGTVVYSTSLASTPSAISAAGNELRFTANATGAFVTSGNVTARIVQSDYIAKNGVVHVIDRVLLNTTENTQAAASAYSSATAAAATQTAAPGVGSGSGSGGNGNGGSGSGGGSGAGTVKTGGGAAAVAALLGSGFWLLV
ncbi:hypothetical protein EX895_000245 [Sporisorium graminicola]|uniref:FAS1 domain-containing protein n=1 Tax=Sporisorium graminicola TaxID=280036 RepID=A0A4U7L0Q0_9BASI|nr:hypothetical protein EX895_000245 [Sporisorium graminicola]TKY90247.1 hypothetical protein EX895_000245 [Sporisorium graminicola]